MGLHNLIFLVMIVAAVILSGTLTGNLAAFQDASRRLYAAFRVFREDVQLGLSGY